VPLELAQQLVYGGEEYARGLGFEPHPDYAPAKALLGEWTGPSAITFGRDGKPFYFQGPHDNPRKIPRTLQQEMPPDMGLTASRGYAGCAATWYA
jgi:hypothetical protein